MNIFVLDNSSKIRCNNEKEKKHLLNDLITTVKDCQSKYGNKRELATETDSRVLALCNAWEAVLSHGLKISNSVLKNVTDLVSGSQSETPLFWNFAVKYLSQHEKERFAKLKHVWTDCGKGRSFIRSTLNEHSLERYILTWLSDNSLENDYEKWSFLRDDEATNLLPNIAAGLNAILFAISTDIPGLNVIPRNINNGKAEPIIATSPPIQASKKVHAARRQIITFDETANSTGNLSGSTSSSVDENLLKRRVKVKPEPNIKSANNIVSDVQMDEKLKVSDVMNEFDELQFSDQALENNVNDSIESNYVEASSYPTASISVTPSSSTSTVSSHEDYQSSSYPNVPHFDNPYNEVDMLKKKVKELEEKCQRLEEKVTGLTIENHRLRSISFSSQRSTAYFKISIPKAFLKKEISKSYYMYEIHITPVEPSSGIKWVTLKRYSEFYKLHKKYQKENLTVKTLDFPPKKKFGNMDAEFVEQRRQRLQVYLRHLINLLPEVSACNTRGQLEVKFPFLK